MQTVMLVDAYSKRGEVRSFQPFTREELLALRPGQSVWFIRNDGKAAMVRINGKVRTWKRNTNRIEIPTKYGLFECHTFTERDTDRLLKAV